MVRVPPRRHPTRRPPRPALLHWTGAAGNQWSTAGNWLENAVPNTGDIVVFDTTTAGFSATPTGFAPVNDEAGLVGMTVMVSDTSPFGNFNITGNGFGLTGNGVDVTATGTAGTATTLATSSAAPAGSPSMPAPRSSPAGR